MDHSECPYFNFVQVWMLEKNLKLFNQNHLMMSLNTKEGDELLDTQVPKPL